jgi:hypothetical protein
MNIDPGICPLCGVGRLKGKIHIAGDFDAPLPDELLKQFNKGPLFP